MTLTDLYLGSWLSFFILTRSLETMQCYNYLGSWLSFFILTRSLETMQCYNYLGSWLSFFTLTNKSFRNDAVL